MEIKKHHISLEPVVDVVAKVGSAAHDVLKKIDEGIEHDYSPKQFYDHAKNEESKVKSVAETVVYTAFREAFDPIHAAIKATTGETLHGHQISKLDRVKAAADVAVTVLKLPKAAKVGYNLAKIGTNIYRSKRN